MKKDFILDKIASMINSYKGSYGKVDQGGTISFYSKSGADWRTRETDEMFEICIQGSRKGKDNNRDWKDNFNFLPTKEMIKGDKRYKAHAGHVRQAMIVYSTMLNLIKNKYNAGKDIVICGHSLGANVAEIIRFMLLDNIKDVNQRIYCIVAGSSRTFNRSARNKFNVEVNNYIWLNLRNDIVHYLPPALFMTYHLKNKIQIGEKKSIIKLLFGYKKWKANDFDHNPKDYYNVFKESSIVYILAKGDSLVKVNLRRA